MSNLAVLGLQWGDEGKGKIVDLLADRFDVIVRSQGGHNAGHTVKVGDQTFVLSLIPSGILREGKQAVIGNGLVIDPAALIREIETLRGLGVAIEGNLFVSNRAHVIFPYHPMMERISEATPGNRKIGTTSRGIGPCYEDKMNRRGIRVAEWIERDIFPDRFRALAAEKNAVAKALGIYEPWDVEACLIEYQGYADRLRPLVCDSTSYLNKALKAGKRLLFEGAQATMLDIDFGTYPYLTSSNSTAGGLSTGSGVSPRLIDDIVGITKAYATRVGEGPFVTELNGDASDALRKAGHEFGTVTGRPRRCGWFDIPMLRYAHAINHLSTLVVTKLDVLDYLEQIPVCTGYRYRGETIDEMPALTEVYAQVEPVYEQRPGWHCSTVGITEFSDLPQAAKDYVTFLEDRLEVEIGGISTGPERDQTIVRPESVFQKVVSA